MNRSIVSLVGLTMLLLGAIGNADAAIVANLATGLNAGGTLQTTGNSVDANWSVNQIIRTNSALVVAPNNADWFGGWLSNGPNSSWITADPNSSSGNGNPLPTFTRTFDLTGFNLSTASISGSWAIDDQGVVELNGNVISTLGAGAWGGLTSFTVAAGSPFFNQGVNTLSIVMTSSDNFLEGARLEGQVSGTPAAAPEPASLAIWSLSALGCAIGACRRRKVA